MTKISSSCKLSLESKDFNRYDVVANEKLHRSEMTDEQFECFVQQLVRTSDREVRKQFVDAIQNKLWEAVRRRLQRMYREKGYSGVVRKRIRSLLKYEFTGAIVSGSASTEYSFDYYKKNNTSGGNTSKEINSFNYLIARGDLKINVPFKGWRFLSNVSLLGSSRWSMIQYALTGAEATHTNSHYMGVSATSDVSLVRRDSRIKIYGKALLDNNWNAPSDRLSTHVYAKGTSSVRHAFGSGFSLYASAEYYRKRYAPPIDPSYNTRLTESGSIRAQASYLFKKAGILGIYDFKDTNYTTNFYMSLTRKHVASLLAHIKLKKGYLRLGGGSGVRQDEFRLLGESVDTKTNGTDIHVDLIAQWRPKSWLTAKLSGSVAANLSEGDFNGWYPSYDGIFKVVFNNKRLMFNVHGSYSGMHINLEQRQILHTAQAGMAFAYRLNDRLNMNLSGSYAHSQQVGYQPYTEWLTSATASVGVQLHKKADLWATVLLGYSRYSFDSDENQREQDNVWGTASLKLRF